MSIFYGDNIRWFIGSVVNGKDNELKLGRVQVRIYGIHDNEEEIKNVDLPWATVMSPSTEGGVSGLGQKPNLKNGSQVFGIFFDGKMSQAPLVLGSIPKMENVTSAVVTDANEKGKVGDVTTSSNNTPDVKVDDGNSTTATKSENVDTRSHAEKNWREWSSGPSSHIVSDGTGLSNGEKSFNYFLNKGFSKEQAAGIIGNLAIESGAELNTSGTGGIAGYTSIRYRDFLTFCGKHSLSPILLQTQLDFIMNDLENNPSRGLSQLKSTTTVPHATSAFATRYLRIAKHRFNDDYPERGEESIEQERIDFANGTFGRFV